MTDSHERAAGETLDQRFLQGVTHLTEWAKHLITVASALMVLGVAILKDLVTGLAPPLGYAIGVLFVASYGLMLAAVWKALALMRQAASTMLTKSERIWSESALGKLQSALKAAQILFLTGLVVFAGLAAIALLPSILDYRERMVIMWPGWYRL